MKFGGENDLAARGDEVIDDAQQLGERGIVPTEGWPLQDEKARIAPSVALRDK